MAEHNDDVPVVNVAALRRDIYRLVVLLLADERVAEVAAFRDLADSESNHESEVSRLLIWVSIACRQLLTSRNTIRKRPRVDGSVATIPGWHGET